MKTNKNKNLQFLGIKSSSPLTLAMSAAVALTGAQSVSAAPCSPVTNPVVISSNDGSSEGSFYAAAMNASGCTNITFAPSVTDIQLSVSIPLNGDINIVGPGSGSLNIYYESGNAFTQGTNGNVHIEGITISDSNIGIVIDDDTLSIEDVVFDGNVTGVSATNVSSVTVVDSTFTGNLGDGAAQAAGLYINTVGEGAEVSIENSNFINNNNASESSYAAAGLKISVGSGDADISINNTTFAYNTASSQVGALSISSGIYDTDIEINQSTFSGNDGYSGAGAIEINNDSESSSHSLSINSTTVFDNYSISGMGGIDINTSEGSPQIDISNSVIANNDTGEGDGNIDLSTGEITSLNHSWVGTTGVTITTNNSSTVNGLNEADVLEDLADNGGFGKTHMPAEGSPLIDAGNPSISGAPDTDQNGNNRIEGDAIDIGATEVQVDEPEDESPTDTIKSKSSSGGLLWLTPLLGVLGLRRRKR